MAILAGMLRKISSIKAPKLSKKRADADEAVNSFNSNSISTSSQISSSNSGDTRRQEMIQEMETRRRADFAKLNGKKEESTKPAASGKQQLIVPNEEAQELDEGRLSSAHSMILEEGITYPAGAGEVCHSLTTPFHNFGARAVVVSDEEKGVASYVTADYNSSYASSCLTEEDNLSEWEDAKVPQSEDAKPTEEAAKSLNSARPFTGMHKSREFKSSASQTKRESETNVKGEGLSPRARELQKSVVDVETRKEEAWESLFILNKDLSQKNARQLAARSSANEQRRDLNRSKRSKGRSLNGSKVKSLNASKSSHERRLERAREQRRVYAHPIRRNRRTSIMERVSIIKQTQKRKTSTQGLGFHYHQKEPTFVQSIKRKPVLREEPTRVFVPQGKTEIRILDTWVQNQITRAGLKKEEKTQVKAPDASPKQVGLASKNTFNDDEVFVLDSFHFGMKKTDRILKSSAFLHTSEGNQSIASSTKMSKNQAGTKVERLHQSSIYSSLSALNMSDVTLSETGHGPVRMTETPVRSKKASRAGSQHPQQQKNRRRTKKSEATSMVYLHDETMTIGGTKNENQKSGEEKMAKLDRASLASTNYQPFRTNGGNKKHFAPELQLDNSGANFFLRKTRFEKK